VLAAGELIANRREEGPEIVIDQEDGRRVAMAKATLGVGKRSVFLEEGARYARLHHCASLASRDEETVRISRTVTIVLFGASAGALCANRRFLVCMS
jgi:hypothetical protein